MPAATAKKTSRIPPARRRYILCGTDFSPQAQRATEAAAAMAGALGEALHLAHAIEIPHLRSSKERFLKWMTASRRRDLRKHADELRQGGVDVKVITAEGRADEMLCGLAQEDPPRLIVVASRRRRGPVERWLLGSVIERTAQRARTPTLVVRDSSVLTSWASGKRPLKVFVCFNFTATSQAALQWAKELCAIGTCEMVVGYVNWPLEDYLRLGGTGPLPLDTNSPQVLAALERDVRACAAEVLGEIPFRVRVEANATRTEIRLAEMAAQEGAGLLIAGSHQYQGFERLWHTSISRGLLHEAPMNLAIVPLATCKEERLKVAPPVRRVLVPTDLSELANAAIPHAYSILRNGGVVHLVHVRPPSRKDADPRFARRPSARELRAADARDAAACRAQLRALVPLEAPAQGIRTEVEVVEGREAADGICEAAERLGVDVICLGTHGRSGLSKTVLGSVAEAVMLRTRRPLFVVRAQPE